MAIVISASGSRNNFSYQGSGQRFGGIGLWVMVRVLGSVCHNRFPQPNPKQNHNHYPKLTLTTLNSMADGEFSGLTRS